MQYAPIGLFCYNRLEYTKQTVAALLQNELASVSDLYIFCDGPKGTEDETPVKRVRDFVKSIEGFLSITIIERGHNLGLSSSLINGINHVLQKHDSIIVLEDDLITAPYFLTFMNEGLHKYEGNERVASIHGHVLPVKCQVKNFFLRGADCWGWATWKHTWSLFEQDPYVLLRQIEQRKLSNHFDLDGAFDYTEMLRQQIWGKVDSWAIRWHASMFLENKLTLYPYKSLVQHIGIQQGKHHSNKKEHPQNGILYLNKVPVIDIPVEEGIECRKLIKLFWKKHGRNKMLKISIRCYRNICRKLAFIVR